MYRNVVPEKQGLSSKIFVAFLIHTYRLCKKHRLRPYRFIARRLISLFPGARYCIIELYPDVHFRIDLLDGYWTNLLLDDFHYEPEILHLLERFASLDYLFIDCGANYGFWSLIVSSNAFGNKPVIAIEPVNNTYSMLAANKELNRRDFPLVKKVIEERSGQQVTIKIGKGHADASIYYTNASKGEEMVETLSIDDMLSQYKELERDVVILKLDVEGAEIAALKGASQLLSTREVLVIYEDHGMDTASTISDFLLTAMAYKIYYCDEACRITEIHSIGQIAAIKTNKVKGYNFIAVKPDSKFHRNLNGMAKKPASVAA